MAPGDAENAACRLPTALNMLWQTLDMPTSDESDIAAWDMGIMQRLGGAGISPENIVVSYDDNGNLFASRLRWVLKYLGHDKAVVVDGGIAAWTQSGGMLTDEPNAQPATTYDGSPTPERLATWRYVYDHLADPGVQIVDVRPLAAYTGDDPGTFRRAGHIPGAFERRLDQHAG
jgi:thiosulfate/3-mercaptopyruvate sulfurtransferase